MPPGRQRFSVHVPRNERAVYNQKRTQRRTTSDPTGIFTTTLPERKWSGGMLLEGHISTGQNNPLGPTEGIRILGGSTTVRRLDSKQNVENSRDIGST